MDGTPTSRTYWNNVGTCLGNVCKRMPHYQHVGLLVATPTSLAVWDLTSAVPHVKHLPWQSGVDLPLTPGSNNLQAALRALGDTTTSSSTGRMPLGATLEAILDTMQQASHAGGNLKDTPTYAGGRILCILGGPPVEIKSRRHRTMQSVATQQSAGTGGHGGFCGQVGRRYGYDTAVNARTQDAGDIEVGSTTIMKKPANEDTDMTASNLSKLYHNTSTELYFNELGVACAQAALGVDVLVLSSHEEDVGLPFLRLLSDRSGAPGPLLCLDAASFEQEVASRVPWNQVFGGVLRMRVSPGFAVDTTGVEGSGEEGPQLAPLYSSGGLMGPATTTEESLWIIGSCNEMTCVTVDMVVKSHVKDRVYVDGVGDVLLRPAVQTCFAYTAIEQQEDGSHVTVRRMKVAYINVPLAHDTESLYASLDPEALAVVLFHKLTVASLQDGLVQTHEIGQQWLQSLMVCAYRSAEEEEVIYKELTEKGLDKINPLFYPQERLLNRNGELSTIDVLLGQGHECLQHVPLMVFALLQCDALRPSMGTFRPSIDARCAASAQMYSMTPSSLVRCVAPRLELWASGKDVTEPIMENMDLSLENAGFALTEHRQGGQDESSELILFLDSPKEILVCDSRHLQASDSDDHSSVIIGKGLERSIKEAVESYRVPPSVVYELSLEEPTGVPPYMRLADYMVEDSQTVQGLQNFSQWKNEVAAMIQE